MPQNIIAHFFTFSDANGTLQINYSPQTRLEYQGHEGHFVSPCVSPGRENMIMQEQSWLGQQVTVVLVPSVEGPSVTLILLLPFMNMSGQQKQEFEIIAIKTTSSGMLPTPEARLTYEVISLQGTAQYLLQPLSPWHWSLPEDPEEVFKAIADMMLEKDRRHEKAYSCPQAAA